MHVSAENIPAIAVIRQVTRVPPLRLSANRQSVPINVHPKWQEISEPACQELACVLQRKKMVRCAQVISNVHPGTV